jgi:hypothetical protein
VFASDGALDNFAAIAGVSTKGVSCHAPPAAGMAGVAQN